MGARVCALPPYFLGSPVRWVHGTGIASLLHSLSKHFCSRHRGKRGARELRRWRHAWGAGESTANVRPGSSPEALDFSGSREPRDLPDCTSQGCAPSHSAPPTPGHPTMPGHRNVAGAPLLTPPNIPAAHPPQRATSLGSNFNPRKVPIVYLQSCFKVTLISKLQAALAGDYSCINQGEIMPVTD